MLAYEHSLGPNAEMDEPATCDHCKRESFDLRQVDDSQVCRECRRLLVEQAIEEVRAALNETGRLA